MGRDIESLTGREAKHSLSQKAINQKAIKPRPHSELRKYLAKHCKQCRIAENPLSTAITRVRIPFGDAKNLKRLRLFRVVRHEVWRFGVPLTAGLASSLVSLRGRSQGHGGLAREQEESERLLQVQADGGIGVAEITDGDVLANVQVEIAATSGQHESASNRGGPYDLIVDEPFDVFEDRVSVVAGLGECGVGVGTEQHGIGAVDTDQTQTA